MPNSFNLKHDLGLSSQYVGAALVFQVMSNPHTVSAIFHFKSQDLLRLIVEGYTNDGLLSHLLDVKVILWAGGWAVREEDTLNKKIHATRRYTSGSVFDDVLILN